MIAVQGSYIVIRPIAVIAMQGPHAVVRLHSEYEYCQRKPTIGLSSIFCVQLVICAAVYVNLCLMIDLT
ncbi:hypothetical protein C2G38_2118039 [Gigaspora rosea]|uniref:Uncharacterized protein n=1 Tax=Gigaspora rosea TaxID=44941 RepID=A0A397U957_9GLOM|nr:hypothetical protein C2G38_2118039 [Gigaspora rosea]